MQFSLSANPDVYSPHSLVLPVPPLPLPSHPLIFKQFSFPQHLFTYKFVTHEDVCNAFCGDTVLAVMAPAGTQLEVPIPETVGNCRSTNLTHYI